MNDQGHIYEADVHKTAFGWVYKLLCDGEQIEVKRLFPSFYPSRDVAIEAALDAALDHREQQMPSRVRLELDEDEEVSD